MLSVMMFPLFPFMCEIRSLKKINSEYFLNHQLNERSNGSTVCFLRGMERVSKYFGENFITQHQKTERALPGGLRNRREIKVFLAPLFNHCPLSTSSSLYYRGTKVKLFLTSVKRKQGKILCWAQY